MVKLNDRRFSRVCNINKNYIARLRGNFYCIVNGFIFINMRRYFCFRLFKHDHFIALICFEEASVLGGQPDVKVWRSLIG